MPVGKKQTARVENRQVKLTLHKLFLLAGGSPLFMSVALSDMVRSSGDNVVVHHNGCLCWLNMQAGIPKCKCTVVTKMADCYCVSADSAFYAPLDPENHAICLDFIDPNRKGTLIGQYGDYDSSDQTTVAGVIFGAICPNFFYQSSTSSRSEVSVL